MNIIELAKEAGFSVGLNDPIIYAAHKRFAALVRAEALEEAAKECEKSRYSDEGDYWAEQCAAAIRGLK